jgi:hypothetical protein
MRLHGHPRHPRLFFEHVICKHGIPDDIITDRGTQFVNRFWERVCSHMSIDQRLSTAFHPQTDGQTERQNQTMEQYLRAFINYEQDNWVSLLPLAEFAYNNSVHASTKRTPFEANYGYHPRMQFRPPKPSTVLKALSADRFIQRLRESHDQLRLSILDAQKQHNKHAGGKDVHFTVGDKVWLSTKNIRTARQSKKLDHKRVGPYPVTAIINKNAYRLDLPTSMKIHNVFNVALLDKYTEPVPGQPTPEPQPVIVTPGEEEWEVERVLDSRYRYRKLQYLVQWAGYTYIRTTWEPAENLENAADLIADYHRANPTKPQPTRRH